MRWLARLPLRALCVAALATGAMAAPAHAAPEDPIFIFDPSQLPKSPPPPYLPFEGACGLTVDLAGSLYVSDYYHHAVDVFRAATRSYAGAIRKVDPLDGPCGVAVDGLGAIYVNNFHRNVEKFVPSLLPIVDATVFSAAGAIDSSHPTGVAADVATNVVYVDDRTYVAAYEPSGAPVMDGGEPLRIGEGTLGDGYGLAVSRFPETVGRVYVADDADDTVKVYDPAADPDVPVQVIDGHELPGGGFGSLDDSAISVDWVRGDVYVADTGGPQYREDPRAVIHVFDWTGAYLGRLKHDVVDAVPVGLAVDNSITATQGRVYVTSGNTENAIVYGYGPEAATMVSTLSAPASGSDSASAAAETPVGSAARATSIQDALPAVATGDVAPPPLTTSKRAGKRPRHKGRNRLSHRHRRAGAARWGRGR